jgi:hypothetical protein
MASGVAEVPLFLPPAAPPATPALASDTNSSPARVPPGPQRCFPSQGADTDQQGYLQASLDKNPLHSSFFIFATKCFPPLKTHFFPGVCGWRRMARTTVFWGFIRACVCAGWGAPSERAASPSCPCESGWSLYHARLAVGGWRLAVGGWRLAVGGWRLEQAHKGQGASGIETARLWHEAKARTKLVSERRWSGQAANTVFTDVGEFLEIDDAVAVCVDGGDDSTALLHRQIEREDLAQRNLHTQTSTCTRSLLFTPPHTPASRRDIWQGWMEGGRRP